MKPFEKEIGELVKHLKRLPPEKRDEVIAGTIIWLTKITDVLEMLGKAKSLEISKKQKKEIEHVISIGPKWLNYTLRAKRK